MQAQKPANRQNLSPLELTHWPQIKMINPQIGKKFAVQVMVGQKSHEMTAEHLILFIELFVGNQPAGRKILKPGDLPEGEFIVLLNKPAKIIAHAFCNLHGLWGNEIAGDLLDERLLN